MSFILFALLFACVQANLNLNQPGCGSLLGQGLLDVTKASFSASSGDPGFPVIPHDAWVPAIKNLDQYLTVDLGRTVKVSKLLFGGEISKDESPSQLKVFYSNDGITFQCIKRPSSKYCRRFYSSTRPPVAGKNVNTVDFGQVIEARYFRFQSLEPDPKYRDGGASLRIQLKGCV